MLRGRTISAHGELKDAGRMVKRGAALVPLLDDIKEVRDFRREAVNRVIVLHRGLGPAMQLMEKSIGAACQAPKFSCDFEVVRANGPERPRSDDFTDGARRK